MHGRCHIDMNPSSGKIKAQMRCYKEASTGGQCIVAVLQKRKRRNKLVKGEEIICIHI